MEYFFFVELTIFANDHDGEFRTSKVKLDPKISLLDFNPYMKDYNSDQRNIFNNPLLPVGTVLVVKEKDNQKYLELQMKSLKISFELKKSSIKIVDDNLKNYLKLKKESKAYNFEFSINIKLTLWALFSPGLWTQYIFMDKFLDYLDNKIAYDRFIENIGWKNISAFYNAQKLINEETKIKK